MPLENLINFISINNSKLNLPIQVYQWNPSKMITQKPLQSILSMYHLKLLYILDHLQYLSYVNQSLIYKFWCFLFKILI